MKKAGWIRFHRIEIEWMQDFTDPQFRYYISARGVAIWDRRNPLFGTFDARTLETQRDMYLSWSVGKICGVKNQLIEKGVFKPLPNFRLKITNAEIFFAEPRRGESYIQSAETNLQRDEGYLQRIESMSSEISDGRRALIKKIQADSQGDFQRSESSYGRKE